eukprot:14398066-Alexandrium_andersonii.AAC.1
MCATAQKAAEHCRRQFSAGFCSFLRSSPGEATAPPDPLPPKKAPPVQGAGGAFWGGVRRGGSPPGEERRKLQKPADNWLLQCSAAFCAAAHILLHKYSGPTSDKMAASNGPSESRGVE